MSGVDQEHLAGRYVDTRHGAGDELVSAELVVHHLAGLFHLRQHVVPAAACVAEGGDCQAGQEGGAQAVAHAVGDGDMQVVGLNRVVEAVARDGVGGFQRTSHRHLVGLVGEDRQELPLDLGGEDQIPPPAHALEEVGVAAGGRHDVPDNNGRPLQLLTSLRGWGIGQQHVEHSQALCPHGDRQVQPQAAVVGRLHHGLGEEGSARGSAVDGHRAVAVLAGVGRHPLEGDLAVVGEKEADVFGAHCLGEHGRHDGRQRVRRRGVECSVQPADEVGVVHVGPPTPAETLVVGDAAAATTRGSRRA